MNFTDQREQLITRRKELDEGNEAIENLIIVLDQRKDEAIRRTFRGVGKFFDEVFRELVPGGKAELVMQRKPGQNITEEEEEDDGEEKSFGKYSGVKIKVAFHEDEETTLIQKLSGGHKSLVALAFIFAIQRADRAPFYLFDEIDANLDVNYKAAVARLLAAESKSAQFIVITLTQELVLSARKFFCDYRQ